MAAQKPGMEIDAREKRLVKRPSRRWGCTTVGRNDSRRENGGTRKKISKSCEFYASSSGPNRPDFRSSASVRLPFIPDVDSPETARKKRRETTGQVGTASDSE